VEHRDRRTRWEGRTSTATMLSEGVSDDACPQGPTTSVGPIERSWTKVVGKPYAGEPHVRFEVAGVGNVATVEL
jgi:hypothetical protein